MRSLLFFIPLLASFHTSLSNTGNHERLKVRETYDKPVEIYEKVCCGLISQSSEASKHPGYNFTAGIGWHKYHHEQVTWAKAIRTCFKEGAHLAVIDTWKEAELLKKLRIEKFKANNLSETTLDKAFIGLHDFYETKELVTVLGQPFKNIEFLSTPRKRHDDFHCVAFDSDKKLLYVSCDWEIPFFCEIPICRLRDPGTC